MDTAETTDPTYAPEAPKDEKFYVMEIFGPTLQGEGSVIGMQTMFIRFGGCDYRCKMCDSLHAVLPRLIKQHGTRMTAKEIMQKLGPMAGHCNMVTLSGGNPAMYDLSELVDLIHNCGMKIAVETQGTLWQDWIAKCDYVTVSPKGPGMGEKFEKDKFDNFGKQLGSSRGNMKNICIKVVVFDQQDIEFAKEIKTLVGTCPFYLSLGNPYPPKTEEQRSLNPDDHHLANVLMERMLMLWEDIKNEPILADARFLPQMHVLLWANAQSV